jgi:S1-C subfamily serine protease
MNKKVTLSLALVILAATLMACQLTNLIPNFTLATAPSVATAAPLLPLASTTTDLATQQDRLTTIYQQFSPGVVTVQTTSGLGSGWVYSSDGYIITNDHVVGTETKVEVDFTTGFKTFGNVIGTDSYSDLAVIKVDAPAAELHPLPLGDSNILQVGQTVIAIGNPFGLSSTMTTGIISALGRSLPSNTQITSGGTFSTADIIQTDAAINPGNSGGPLLNLNGEVIGITSQIETNNSTSSGQPSNSGVGFAISINIVKRVVPSLIQDGKFAYPYLGVSAIDALPLSVIQSLGLTSTSGAYVTTVVAGGPSEKAGIQAGTTSVNLTDFPNLNKGGDLIVAIDGQPVVTFDDMIGYLILNKSPGETVTLTVLRGSRTLEIPVVLGTRP